MNHDESTYTDHEIWERWFTESRAPAPCGFGERIAAAFDVPVGLVSADATRGGVFVKPRWTNQP